MKLVSLKNIARGTLVYWVIISIIAAWSGSCLLTITRPLERKLLTSRYHVKMRDLYHDDAGVKMHLSETHL